MLFHFHRVQVVQAKLRDTIDTNGEFSAKVSLFSFEVDFFIDLRSRENVVTDGNVVNEDALQFVCLGAKNFIFLECLQIVDGEVTDNCASFGNGLLLVLFEGKL